MKNIYLILTTLFFVTFSNSQTVNSFGGISPTLSGESVFADASSFSGVSTNIGRGLAFPRTSLVDFTFVSEGSSFGNFATGYDGMIVYNTASSISSGNNTPTTGSGIGGQAIEPGFYYFSNPSSSGDTSTGQWLPLGGARFTLGTTETETNTVIGSDAEYAIRVPGTADGSNTLLTLDAAFDLDTVKQLRKCIVYEGDVLIMEATSAFDATGNTIVTGDGMVNLLLNNTTADAYTAECYYTKN